MVGGPDAYSQGALEFSVGNDFRNYVFSSLP